MSDETNTDKTNAPALLAYFVPDREKPYWTRIGAAWAHGDGEGFSLDLELIPAKPGRIVLRTKPVKEEA